MKRIASYVWVRVSLPILVMAAIVAAYVFFVTAGRGTPQPAGQRYHHMLAEGFLAGQLHLLVPPSPALLQQANPYDVKTSSRHWLWDAVLYDGKYYLYFGPAPAVLIAGIKLVFGRDVVVQDQHLVLTFVVGRLIVGATLLALALRWLFPSVSPWMLVPALLVFGLANPYPYQLGRPGVYEVAIDSAQFFLLLGLLAAFLAVRGCRTRTRELVLIGAAGCCWAVVLGCRISLLFAVATLVLLTALSSSSAPHRFREFLLRLCLAGAPVALALLALGLYNHARFGSFTEFGTNYQLTGRRYDPTLRLVLPNLHAYLFRRFTVSCEFPYLGAPFHAQALTPSWVTPDSGYSPKEPTVGLFVGAPFVVFAMAALAAALSALARRRSAGAHESTDALYLWLVGCCSGVVLLAGLPALGVWFSTMRYLSDVAPAALLLAIVGFWTLLARTSAPRPRYVLRSVQLAGAVLAIYTVTVGLLLGFQGGYYGAIRRHNRALHAQLVKTLSLCTQPPAAPPNRAR